jgi:hypothetical protein
MKKEVIITSTAEKAKVFPHKKVYRRKSPKNSQKIDFSVQISQFKDY